MSEEPEEVTAAIILREQWHRRGRLIAEDLVAEAADPSHPMHGRFEWDNNVAGHQYRLVQARQIIRAVRIRTAPDAPKDLREWWALREDNEPKAHYEPIDAIMADPLAQRLLLAQAERDLRTFESRYQHLREYRELLMAALGSAS